MALALLPRSMNTAPDNVIHCPSKGIHWSCFLAIMDVRFGNILLKSYRKEEGSITQLHAPSKPKNIQHALMIANKNRRARVQIFFTLH